MPDGSCAGGAWTSCPSCFNVLHGEMSLVGPRPEEVALVARYTDDQRRRLAVKPGMTGPMQVNGRGRFAVRRAAEAGAGLHRPLLAP